MWRIVYCVILYGMYANIRMMHHRVICDVPSLGTMHDTLVGTASLLANG